MISPSDVSGQWTSLSLGWTRFCLCMLVDRSEPGYDVTEGPPESPRHQEWQCCYVFPSPPLGPLWIFKRFWQRSSLGSHRFQVLPWCAPFLSGYGLRVEQQVLICVGLLYTSMLKLSSLMCTAQFKKGRLSHLVSSCVNLMVPSTASTYCVKAFDSLVLILTHVKPHTWTSC